MNIDHLHYFCTVFRTGSLVRASELLHISQPAISKAIKSLEVEVGHKLVTASGRGIVVTDFGKKLALEAAPLIQQLNSLGTEHASSPKNNILRISTFEVFSTYFLGKIIPETFADMIVEVYELIPGPLEDSIVNERSDFGITYVPIPHVSLDILKVTTIEMGIFGIKRRFDNLDFKDLPFVIPNLPISGTPSKAMGLDGWPDDRRPRKVAYKVSMMETALELCRRGASVGYFPKFVIDLHNEVVNARFKLEEISTPIEASTKRQDVFLVKRKSSVESPYFKKLSKALRNHASRAASP